MNEQLVEREVRFGRVRLEEVLLKQREESHKRAKADRAKDTELARQIDSS